MASPKPRLKPQARNPSLALKLGRLLGPTGTRLIEGVSDTHITLVEEAIKKGDYAEVARQRRRFVRLVICQLALAVLLALRTLVRKVS